LLREIGKGAMATVYEAEHLGLGKRVAVKKLHSHLAVDATASARFLREGRAASQIKSPHVVDVFDVGVEQGIPYLVMELLEGADLAAVLRERRKLPVSELVDLMLPVVSAVHAAHDVGVIHRDLKPSNVFLGKGDSEVLLGTVHYMSPEQTRGGRNASAESDQYALGVMLYECSTGTKPFAGNSPYALMHAIVSSKVPPPSTIDPDLSPEFNQVVLRAMHRDPQKRFSSVQALGVALLPWASEAQTQRWAPALGVSAKQRVAPAPSARSRRRAAFATLALFVAIGAFSVRASRGRSVLPSPSAEPVQEAAALQPPSAVPSASAVPSIHEPPLPAPAQVPRLPASTSHVSTRSGTTAPAGSGGDGVPSRGNSPERGTNGALIVE
jgi:serine/threonine-protein kinase